MKVLKPLTNSQVGEPTQTIFSGIKQKIGRVPNLYAAMANSPNLLGGFLTFEATLKQGSFSTKEGEAIALAVSQSNQCEYCLSAHSALGEMAGYSVEEIINIRKGTVADPKLQALITLATELTDNKGKTSQGAIDAFLSVGYTAQSLADLIGLVSIRNITNYIYSNGDFEIDFPVAAPLMRLATIA
jgi:uncharacterized peroxidase-related enzyme